MIRLIRIPTSHGKPFERLEKVESSRGSEEPYKKPARSMHLQYSDRRDVRKEDRGRNFQVI